MKCLITGGSGFIGSHLSDYLLREGHSVKIVDDLSTGRLQNIAKIISHSNCSFIEDNILTSERTDSLVEQSDVIFHLASTVGVRLVMDEPVKTIENIFQSTDVMLKAASRHRKPILITSTSEVYGKSKDVPFREDGDRLSGATTKQRWAYACAKALDEFLALAHWKETQLPVIIVRLFNTVGPRQSGRYGMVLPNFISSALAGESLHVHGDGSQTRCFCHVHDVVDALSKLIVCEDAFGKVFNVGSQDEISIIDLANRVVSKTQSSSTIEMIPYSTAFGEGFEDMQRRVPCIERISEQIDWKPQKSLDQIITDIIADQKGNPDHE